MLKFKGDELTIVQNKGASQKVLSLELPSAGDHDGTLTMSDLTSTKIIDRAATITSFGMYQDELNPRIGLVYDKTRLIIFKTLEKEIERKFKFKHDSKAEALLIEAVCFTDQASLLILATQGTMLRVYELVPDETSPPKMKFETKFKANKAVTENSSITQSGMNILVQHNATTYILEAESFKLLKQLDEKLIAFNLQNLILQHPETHRLFLREISNVDVLKFETAPPCPILLSTFNTEYAIILTDQYYLQVISLNNL